jgi:hypothetical protein
LDEFPTTETRNAFGQSGKSIAPYKDVFAQRDKPDIELVQVRFRPIADMKTALASLPPNPIWDQCEDVDRLLGKQCCGQVQTSIGDISGLKGLL